MELLENERKMRNGKLILANIQESVAADETWIIVRSTKHRVVRSDEIHVPELSPSEDLLKRTLGLKRCFKWGRRAFDDMYAPVFIQELKGSKEAKMMLNLLYFKIMKEDKTICIKCFCTEETLCHRSIIGGLLKGKGVQVESDFRLNEYEF